MKTAFKIGDKVKAATAWADEEFPDTEGVIIGLRCGGLVAVFETKKGRSPRALHLQYLQAVT